MTGMDSMPQYDGMDYEDLVSEAQFLWMENVALKSGVEQAVFAHAVGKSKDAIELLEKVSAQLLSLADDMLSLLKLCHGDALYGPYGAVNRAPTGDEIQGFADRVDELKGEICSSQAG